MKINNPFAGNKAEPIEKISFKTYEEEYTDKYHCDFSRQWCDINETSMLVVHRELEQYILVKFKIEDKE